MFAMKSTHIVLALALVTGSAWEASAQSQSPVRVIAPLRGDVYTASEDGRTTMFVVTPEGIVIVDPLNAPFARWLANELNVRFPGRAVQYVVYSALEFERVGGAGAFPGRPDIVAHDTIGRTIEVSRHAFPQRLAGYDYNLNGLLELDELTAARSADMLPRLDRNADGHLSPEEAWSEIRGATRPFLTRYVITLGGKTIELVYLGPEGTGAIAVNVSADRIAFAATLPSVTDPFAEASLSTGEVMAWVSLLRARPFDELLMGNGQMILHAQLAAVYEYVHTLVAAVASGMENGRTVGELQHDPRISSFAGTPFAATRDADIATLYQRMKMIVVDGYAGGLGNYVSMDSSKCHQGYICTHGTQSGVVRGIGVGISIRRWRAAVEWSSGFELATSIVLASGNQADYGNSRESHVSLLGGYRTAPRGRFNIAVLTDIPVAHRVL